MSAGHDDEAALEKALWRRGYDDVIDGRPTLGVSAPAYAASDSYQTGAGAGWLALRAGGETRKKEQDSAAP